MSGVLENVFMKASLQKYSIELPFTFNKKIKSNKNSIRNTVTAQKKKPF